MVGKRNNLLNNLIGSPCIRNCCLDEGDICLGCFRHVDEIIEWGTADNVRRACILDNVRQRKDTVNLESE